MSSSARMYTAPDSLLESSSSCSGQCIQQLHLLPAGLLLSIWGFIPAVSSQAFPALGSVWLVDLLYLHPHVYCHGQLLQQDQ